MLVRPRLIGFLLFGSVLLSGTAWAQTSALQGIVRDANGRPVSGADIRIEGKTNSSWNKVVKTDARGHYLSSGLPAGTYRVTLIVDGSVKTSINNTAIKNGTATQLNFALKASAASKTPVASKKAKHMVWVPARTGSHIGGAWVEIDESGSQPEMEHVETVNGEALRKLQSTQTNPAESSPMGR